MAQSVKNDWLRLKLAGKQPDEIRKTLDKRYANLVDGVNELRGEDVFQSFLNAYAAAIDPHTDYMTPRSATNLTISISTRWRGSARCCSAGRRRADPRDRARRSGRAQQQVEAGRPHHRRSARCLRREMKDVIGWRDRRCGPDLIRGPATQVRLDVVSAEAPLDSKTDRLVLITRAKVRLEDARAKAETITLPAANGGQPAHTHRRGQAAGFYQDVGARRRNDDYASATRRTSRKMLAQFRAQKVDGVVLDLRNNGGGSLGEAIELTGLFIDKGRWCRCANPAAGSASNDDDKAGVAWDGPLAVLVNRGSASASGDRGRRDPGLRARPGSSARPPSAGHRAEHGRPRPLAGQREAAFGRSS